jgi:hypothetical protein
MGRIDEVLWEAKEELIYADYAALNYKYALQDCYVEDYTYRAKCLIDKARNILIYGRE